MSSLVLSGDTSGTVSLSVPAVAGSNTITIAAQTGTLNAAGPAFSVYMSANQSVTSSTYTKVAFNTEDFDTNSNYDTTTYRFTPTVAGYYQITGCLYPNTTVTAINSAIYKNGSILKIFSGTTSSASASALIYLNGSTDYIELYGYLTGTTPAILSTSSVSYFSGCLVRGA